jgi:hypothetical protein
MYMDIDEIHAKYDGQWVYMINLAEDEQGQVIGGEIAAYSDSRKKILQEMLDSKHDSIYILYAGEIPKGIGGVVF